MKKRLIAFLYALVLAAALAAAPATPWPSHSPRTLWKTYSG